MAGRPRASDPKVVVSLSMLTSTVDYFTERAKRQDLTVGRYLSQMLERQVQAKIAGEQPPTEAQPKRREAYVGVNPKDCVHPPNRILGGNWCAMCGTTVREGKK